MTPPLGLARRLAFLLPLAFSALLSPALAQSNVQSSAISDSPCAPQGPTLTPQMRAEMLKPGAKPLVIPPAQLEAYRRFQMAAMARDFANLCRYKSDNAKITKGPRPRVVFMGDSITEAWEIGDPSLFTPDIIDRGISGQTSQQMVLRFYQDVVALRPQTVHILAGTNDLAGNTGPSTPEDFKNNIRAMVDLAQVNGIEVILASILPTNHYAMQPDYRPAEQVRTLNAWLQQFARERKLVFANYYPVLATPSGGLKGEFTNDGLHPTYPGYTAMRPIFDAALKKVQDRTR